MKKSERLKPRIKIKFKYFILTHILTLFFALAPASPAGWPNVFAAGNIFNSSLESAYSEPFSKLIEFLNEKKNELEKYDGDFTGAKVFLSPAEEEGGNNNSILSADEINPAVSSFASAVFESVKSFVVDNPRQYFGTVFESVKNFVFPGDSQNSFEYKSPTSEENAREMENLKQQYAEAIDETKAISQNFNLLQNELEKIKNSGVVVRQPVIEQKTVEKTIEKIVSGLSQNDLDSGLSNIRTELNNLNTNLLNQINNLSVQSNRQTSAVYQAVSLTNKIDSLSGTRLTNITVSGVSGLTDSDIPDTITASNYLLLTGGTITGSTTISGQTNLSNATTSLLTVSNGAWFTSGNVGIGTTSPYAKLSVVGPVVAEYFHATSTTATSTFSGQTVAGFAPTLAHSFGSWSVGASGANPLGASFIINPSSAASDSNLLSLSVNGSAKFLVDAEGDIFANAVTIVGGTTLSTTTASTFTVENNTYLGDATTTDITYFNSRIADSLIPTADNLLDLGDSTNWLRWRTGYFGTSVGIGGTATSTGTQLTASGLYLIDSNNTLSINTTNNKAVSFGTGNVVLPYASTTALTISGSAYIGSLNGPLQANNGLVSATTSVGSIYGGTGLDSSALTGLAQIVSGTWSASSTLSAAFGGTGWGNLQANSILLGNGAGRIATTSAGTDGYVLGLSAGVPTWLATSTLSTITGTLAVAKGGTGQTSFGQGWLNSNGTDLSASTSPTVNYITATSTTATSTFPYLSITTNSNLGTVVGGTWQGTAIGDAYLTKSGDWTGTLDTYNGSDLLARANHTGTQGVATLSNYDWTFLNNYGAINLTGSSTKPIWAQGGINASSTSNFVYASSTALTISGNSYLGTVSSGVWNGTAISNQYGGTGIDSSALTGLAQIVAGTWSASSTLSAAFGGTGWGNLQANSILLGNGAGRIATTSAGTDGYVLGLSAGVPTWLATSTLSTITGTLTVAKGGTGQTSFGQGWLNSDGTTLTSSTSPTVNYIYATSTTATSTFPYLSITTNSNLGTVIGGTWQGTAVGDAYLTKSGDWTGTLDTYNGSDLLARANHTGTQGVATLSNYDWTFLNNYGVINLTASSTKPIWAQGGINASSTSNFVYASTTALTISGNSYLGTISSGSWNGTAISNQYGGTGIDSSALTGIAQIVSGTWSASSTLSTAYGGTGWNSIQANSILLGNGSGRIATTSAGTDGYVLALSAGVPTWLATSTLSTITGTLTVAKGGTGQTSFGQGWLHSDGTTLTSSTSPTVNYITATSTTATSTFPYLSVTTNSNLGTVVGGTWQGTAIGDAYLTKSGDWTGTLDTYNGSDLLARANHTGTQNVSTLSNYDWTFLNNYGAINLTGSSTKPIWAQGGINASSTSNFVYASTTALTVSGSAYFPGSGIWNSSGNVGIGTTTPGALLHLNNSGASKIYLESPATGYNNIMFREAGALTSFIQHVNSNYTNASERNLLEIDNRATGGAISFHTGGAERFRLANNGNIGIGTGAPDSIKLDVEDDIEIGTGTTGCVRDADNTTLVGACVSDANLKKNITSLSSVIGDLSQLRPVTFEWRNDEYDWLNGQAGVNYGLVAQEVEQVFPEMVQTDSRGYKRVSYDIGLSMRMLQGIKEISSVFDGTSATTTGAASIRSLFAGTTTPLVIDADGNVGIGTTTPNYKLQVAGDIAATAFINTSTKTAKKDIAYLSSSQEEDFLDKIKNTSIANYHYNIENENNPLRLGLIAEEAPSEILSVDGKGVDVYKMATFTLGGVKALQKEIEKMKIDLAALSAGAGGAISGSDSLFSWITDKFKTALGIGFEQGKICLEDVCVNKTQLKELLEKNNISQTSSSSTSSSNSSSESSSAASSESSASAASSASSSEAVSSSSSESSSSSGETVSSSSSAVSSSEPTSDVGLASSSSESSSSSSAGEAGLPASEASSSSVAI